MPDLLIILHRSKQRFSVLSKSEAGKKFILRNFTDNSGTPQDPMIIRDREHFEEIMELICENEMYYEEA